MLRGIGLTRRPLREASPYLMMSDSSTSLDVVFLGITIHNSKRRTEPVIETHTVYFAQNISFPSQDHHHQESAAALNAQIPNTYKLIAGFVVTAPFFSCHPRPPCLLHLLPSSSFMLRQVEKSSAESNTDGASHHAKQPSARLTGFGPQQAMRAGLVVSLDATTAKVTLDGIARVEGSGTPSGQVVTFEDMMCRADGSRIDFGQTG